MREIACSQLCGLGHYRMRGFYTVQTQGEYDAWFAEETALLSEP
jgi:cytochrome c oxidase subunit 2